MNVSSTNKNTAKSHTKRRFRNRGRKNARLDRRVFPISNLRYSDVLFTLTSSTTTVGYTNLTSGIVQGLTQGERISDTIYVSRMECRFQLVSGTTDITNRLRFAFFRWNPNSLSLIPGTSSILESPTTFGVQSPLNFEGRREYRIMRDKTYNLVGLSTVPTPYYQVLDNFNLNLNNTRIDYNVSASTGCGHIYLLNLSDSAVPPSPQYSYVIRIWYHTSF